jgi:release factor glutamine methyltransferase
MAGSRTSAGIDVRAALKQATARLNAAGVPSHTLAAELLLMHALGRDRAWLYAHPEAPLDSAAGERYFELVARRSAGTPTQYLIGRQEFWGLEFEVTPDVLIPRPETEHVMEVALERLGQEKTVLSRPDHSAGAGLRIADVGTGSGCLAVALARELSAAEFFATDISAAALAVAQRNAARHAVAARIRFLQCNLLDAFLAARPETYAGQPAQACSGARRFSHGAVAGARDGASAPEDSPAASRSSPRFDLIVSNPPYVGRDQAGCLPREIREHEPEIALFAGATGMEVYAPLLDQAAQLLVSGGVVVLELGYGAAERVRALVDSAGCWTAITVTNDLAGIPRVLAAARL